MDYPVPPSYIIVHSTSIEQVLYIIIIKRKYVLIIKLSPILLYTLYTLSSSPLFTLYGLGCCGRDPIYKFMNTSGNHLENVYTSLFFYNLSLNFLFFFYSHHLRGTKLCVPPPIRVEKTDFILA